MGSNVSSLLEGAQKSDKIITILVGLPGAGKTTLLSQRNKKLLQRTHCKQEIIKFKDSNFFIYDMQVTNSLCDLWTFYLAKAKAVIFVLDSTDNSQKHAVAKQQLHALMQRDELQQVKLLILANKQDLPGAHSVGTLIGRLNLVAMKQEWQMHKCSAKKDENYLLKALEILWHMLNGTKNKPDVEIVVPLIAKSSTITTNAKTKATTKKLKATNAIKHSQN